MDCIFTISFWSSLLLCSFQIVEVHTSNHEDFSSNFTKSISNTSSKNSWEADPVFLCAKGFSLDNKKCIKKELLTAKFGCKNEGAKLIDNFCITYVIKTPRYHCPENYERINDECMKYEMSPHFAICPHKYIMSESKTCVLYEKAEAKPFCETDELLVEEENKAVCKKELETDVILSCPQMYKLSEKFCEKKELLNPKIVCPNGYQINESNNTICIKHQYVDAKPTCTEGFTLEYDACKKKIKLKNSHCAKDVFSTANCISNERPSYKCPSDMILINSNKVIPSGRDDHYICVNINILPPNHTCVHNQTDSSCSEALSKTLKIIHPSCPFGYSYNSAENKCDLIQSVLPIISCTSDANLLPSEKDCYKTLTKPITMGCPDTYELVHDSCEKTLVSKPNFVCDSDNGYILGEDNICVRYNYLTPSMSCPPHFNFAANNTKCVSASYKNAQFLCPNEFSLVEGNSIKIHCLKQTITKPKLKCPKGFLEIEDGCQREHKEHAIAVCDKDYDVVHDQCIKELREHPVIMCPIGTKYRGDSSIDILALNKPNQLCEHIVRMNPTLACPPDFVLVGQTCIKHLKSVGVPMVPAKKLIYQPSQNMYIPPYYFSQ